MGMVINVSLFFVPCGFWRAFLYVSSSILGYMETTIFVRKRMERGMGKKITILPVKIIRDVEGEIGKTVTSVSKDTNDEQDS